MEARIDFLRMLDIDLVFTILMCLNDPADLVRASAVSKSWEMFMISYGVCKKLCVKKFPQLAIISYVTEESDNYNRPGETSCASLQREHRAYTSLFRALTSFPIKCCVAFPISTSSTNRPAEERIIIPLHPRDQIIDRVIYWSSKGQYDPKVPEILIYDLDDLSLITEVIIAPYQAMFQDGCPIYSSKSVRFRTGHPKSNSDIDRDFFYPQEDADDKIIWTYTSETFPMAQESCLQSFKFPEPVLCIGGFLQIELLGRAQKQEYDGKYYICLSHIQAIGRQLSPAFGIDISQPSNTISLRYNDKSFRYNSNAIFGINNTPPGINYMFPFLPPRDIARGNRQLMDMINMHQNNFPNIDLDLIEELDMMNLN